METKTAMAEHTLATADFELLMKPPRITEDLPGIGGRLRSRPEDFVVREIPAYSADGTLGSHLLLTLKKCNLSTEDALREVARGCRIARSELGLAGLKDRHAITEQQISAPATAAAALASFRHPQIELGPAKPHSHKLRRGHLRGNVFELTIRDLAVEQSLALDRLDAKIAALRAAGGLHNLYGVQRFGADGRNIRRGLALLAEGARRRRKADFLVSAGQSALFNLYVLERHARGLSRRVLAGDILKKTDSGGLFTCDDPEVDQERFDAGEIGLTGPIFGGRMMAPPPDSAAGKLELAILERVGLAPSALSALGKKIPGTRRPCQLRLGELQIRPATAVELASQDQQPHNPSQLAEGLQICFRLPAGSYATQFTHEIQGPTDTSP